MSGEPVVSVIAEQLRHTVPGGIGTYVRGLLQGLDELDPHLRVEPWTSRLPVPVRSRLWDHGIGTVRGNVVHATSLAFPPRASSLVVMVHDLAWRDAPETFPRRGLAWHERAFERARRAAERFVVPSSAVAAQLDDAGVEAERVVEIEEGSDHLPPPDHAAATALIDGEFLLTVGTLQPRKNVARLVEAYRRAHLDVPLLVVGPAGWGDAVRPADGVILAGAVSEAALAALYERARAFVYVPLVEGFGLPPVEAMRAGAPVVTSVTVPSSAGAALEVDPYDVDAIAGAIAVAARDGSARDELIRRGRSRAEGLTWRAAAARHVQLWTSLL